MLFGAIVKRIHKTKGEPLRVPLVELFGWTIVAAIASLAIRHMNISVLLQIMGNTRATLMYSVMIVLVPVAGAWVLRMGMRWPLVPLGMAASVVAILVWTPFRSSAFLVVVVAEAAYIAIAAVLFRLVLRAEKASIGPEEEPTADHQ